MRTFTFAGVFLFSKKSNLVVPESWGQMNFSVTVCRIFKTSPNKHRSLYNSPSALTTVQHAILFVYIWNHWGVC